MTKHPDYDDNLMKQGFYEQMCEHDQRSGSIAFVERNGQGFIVYYPNGHQEKIPEDIPSRYFKPIEIKEHEERLRNELEWIGNVERMARATGKIK